MDKVLVVDDEPVVCGMIGKYLRAKGFDVDTASDGEQALEKCGSFAPQVILLDIRMPQMDGLEALEWIRGNFPDTEVIMTTALNDVGTAVACLKKGAFGYQTKPLDLEALVKEISRALEHRIIRLNRRMPDSG